MTDAEIKQLQELVALGEKATPGPWHAGPRWKPAAPQLTLYPHEDFSDHRIADFYTRHGGYEWPDIAFVVASSGARPALAALLREHAAMKKALEFYANHEHWHEIDTACLDNNPLECKAVPMVPQEEDGGTSYFADCGDNARAALEALKEQL